MTPAATSPLRVLVVDDNPDDRALVARELAREFPGVRVEEAGDLEQLGHALRRDGHDLAITDYHLKWSDGISVLRAVKTRWPDCPVIMLTGTGSEEVAVEAMKAGLDDYVLKSARHRVRLPAAVRLALERSGQRRGARDAETRYRELFETVPVGIYRTTPDGTFLDANSAMAEMLGFPDRDALMAVRATELYVDPADRDRWLAVLERDGVVRDYEVRVWCRERRVIWLRNTARVVRDAAGRVVAYEGTVEDVTERRRAEEALRASERRLKAILDSALDAVVTMDVAGVVTGWNPQAERVFGWTAAEAVGARLAHLVIPTRHRTAHERGLASFHKTGRGSFLSRRFEIEALHRDGHEFPVELTVTPIRVADTWLFAGFLRDISDRKLADAALRESEGKYRTLVNEVSDGFFATDEAGVITFANRALAAIHGLHDPVDLIGHHFSEYVTPAMVEQVREAFRRSMEGAGTPNLVTVEIARPDGATAVVEVKSTLMVEEGRIVGSRGVVRDVTERHRLEAQFRQAQKMEAMGRLAGGVAHDFNNLLTVIMGECDYALSELEGDSPVRESLEEVRRAGVRATALTRQLLAFSRKQPADPSVFSPDDLLADVDKMLKRLIGAHIQVVSRSGAEGGRVRADRGQIEQVLINLVVNAGDAMPNGGMLVIETANVDLDEDYARSHPDVTPGPYVRLAVSDTGTGIPDDVKAHLFEPFFTTKERGKGTGLGLATCHGIVKQWGGHIGVYSEVGIGTTMKAYLPRVDEVAADPAAGVVAAPLHGSETILLVEDEPAVRQVAARILRGQGYTVLEAGEWEQALRLLEQHQEQVHLLLTDVVLPKLGGRELAERVSSRRPGIRVLFISGYTDDVTMHNGLLEPGAALLQKPFTAESVGRRVREALDTARSGA